MSFVTPAISCNILRPQWITKGQILLEISLKRKSKNNHIPVPILTHSPSFPPESGICQMKSSITCYLTSSLSLARHALPPNNQATLPSLSQQADYGTWCWLMKDKEDMAPGTSWYSLSLPRTSKKGKMCGKK